MCDINAMTRESPGWTEESKLVLESQLLLATEGPLCLDPSIEVAQVANQLQFNKNKFHTPGIRRYVYQLFFPSPLSDIHMCVHVRKLTAD